MKTNTNKKNSATKKLIPAVSMLTVSAMMLSTATYAWFTMSKDVSVTGMEVKTKVAGNLLICATNAETDFTTVPLSQTRQALLEPVSTVSGTDGSFFYTVNAKGNGDAVTDAYTAYTEAEATTNGTATALGKAGYDAAFNTAYGITPAATTQYDTAYGYVDYVFYLKATGDEADQYIKMTECNLTYNNAAIAAGTTVGTDIDRAWRLAIFAEPVTVGDTSANVTASGDTAQVILTLASAANQSDTGGANYAVSGTAAAPTALSKNYNVWTNSTAANSIGTVAAGATAYYKVTARLWLEGEDTTCTTKTYAQLGNSWKLDLGFALNGKSGATGSKTAVTSIGSVTPTP